MDVQPDFKDLLSLFNAHHVEYVIVGSYALAFHGAPRYTGDIDLFVRPTEENAGRILNALADFGFGSLQLQIKDFVSPDQVIQLGIPPVRIDLLTSISGRDWESVQEDKVTGKYGDLEVFYIGKKSYLLNKKASGRAKDLADVEALGEELPPIP